MKISSALLYSLMIGSLVLQGCATTSSTRNQAAASATTAAPVATPAQAAQPAGAPAAAIPEQNGKPVVKGDSKENFEAIVVAIHQQIKTDVCWR